MKRKITFIGAGSLGFTYSLARDILSYEAFQDAELALMDIHEGRLEYSRKLVEKAIKAGGYGATVTTTTDRVKALEGADGVLITILQGGVDVWRHDIEIPKKFGVDICVGDTRGPSGIFRFLRTAPVMLDIIRDAERVCPKAVVLNYTNPMAMLCSYLQKNSSMNITGLCHSVQGTASMLAKWIGAPLDEVTYTCAGVNHQSFYLEYLWKGEDANPLIKEAILTRPEVRNEEIVRNEMFLQLGLYPTESSGHDSEYCAWFRKRPDLIEKYCTHGTGWNPGLYASILNEYIEREHSWEDEIKKKLEEKEVNLERGGEYAANIFNAMFGNYAPFEFNGNITNNGVIPNLPADCCVEVPMMATRGDIRPFYVGPLPDHLAIMINNTAMTEDLAVKAMMEGDGEKIYQAILFDPLTSAVLSMEEIREMTKQMFEQNKDYLNYFKTFP
jgi:alpha-galactosidase